MSKRTRLTEVALSMGIGTYSSIFEDSQRDSFTHERS